MRQVQRVLASEGRRVNVLFWLYLAYAGYLAWLTVLPWADATVLTPSALVVGRMLLPAIALAIVVVALRHLEREPFACAVALAGLQTIHLADALAARGAGLPWLTLGGAVLLWAVAVAMAQSDRIVREWHTQLAFEHRRSDDVRRVAAILITYAGTLALAILLDVTSLELALAHYGGLAVIGAVATVLLGREIARETLPLRCDWLRAGPLVLAATAFKVLFLWWYVSLLGARWAPFEIDPSFEVELLPLLLLVVLPSVLEEWLCRGVLWAAVRRSAGPAATVLVTATLFALLHRHGSRAMLVVPTQLVGGLVLGWVRARTGSVVPCIVCHAAFNASVLCLLRPAV